VLGPKYGKALPKILAAVRTLDPRAGAVALREQGELRVAVDGEPLVLLPEEVEVVASAREGYVAAEDHGYVVALETALSPELLAEGLVRDLTHHLQDVRKRAGLEIEDAIDAWLTTDAALAEIVRRDSAYVADETLARHLRVMVAGAAEERPPARAHTETIPAAKLGGHEVAVAIAKVAQGTKAASGARSGRGPEVPAHDPPSRP
jgi:isoleucyl-tRNA synthetase